MLFSDSQYISCREPFPSDLQYANVTPLYKKDDSTNKENYRPISIFINIWKADVSTNYIVYIEFTIAFRKGYNAQHSLLRLKNKLSISLDKKENIRMFMMDLSKTFDCIPNEPLIAKLHAYGSSRESLKFNYSYLKGRSQWLNINAEFNSWKKNP